ncbi:unnamed protein product [Darwinula stevensoni]|uniref:Uncharacterized protein n=1 Tax=Darwinula stevensoni TaxID=69355 RepID=A0A7R8XL22_9CRUS|nr:unnamed protein product [Darwinula stevensoni]CAG0895859.1 unnamed protein product [Darwinula stevensoni]
MAEGNSVVITSQVESIEFAEQGPMGSSYLIVLVLILSIQQCIGDETPINATSALKRRHPDLENMISVWIAISLEHAKHIDQLKADYDHLLQDNKNLKHENENLRLDNENLKSHLQEYGRVRDDAVLRLKHMEERFQYMEAVVLQITPQTCQAFANLGIRRSGTYLVDPDGALVGDPPIKVFCDMETDPVSTIVEHDSMKNDTEIDHCASPGCYARKVTYDASMKQMVALMDQSLWCHQRIKYDCISAALSTGAIHYAWWVDRHSDAQFYWHGSNAGEHVCKCGLTKDCVDQNLQCNCDAEAPLSKSDSGEITNIMALPIVEVRFGVLQFEGQDANYTLGGLVCRGYHMIKRKDGRLDIVLCQMDLEESDPEFQVETGEDSKMPGQSILLDLKKNDTVYVYMEWGNIVATERRHAHFVGYLLHPM